MKDRVTYLTGCEVRGAGIEFTKLCKPWFIKRLMHAVMYVYYTEHKVMGRWATPMWNCSHQIGHVETPSNITVSENDSVTTTGMLKLLISIYLRT